MSAELDDAARIARVRQSVLDAWWAKCEKAYRDAWDAWEAYALSHEGERDDEDRRLFHEMDQCCDDLHEARAAREQEIRAVSRTVHRTNPQGEPA